MLKLYFILSLLLFTYTKSFAYVTEIELPLMSYHIKEDRGYRDAPLKLDSDGTYVFNPGLLIGFDSRESTNTNGLSFLAKGGFLQDCDNKTVIAAGGGVRYRVKPFENVSFDFNGYGMVANGVKQFGEAQCPAGFTCPTDPDVGKRETVFLPLANLGINYNLKSGKTLGVTLTFIPEDSTIAATSGTHLLFLTVNLMI